MKERNVFLFLVAIIILTSIILFTNIGYANENLISSNTNYSSKDFNVEFNKNSNNISNNINIISSKKVSLNTIVLNNLEETQVFTIPVINNSNNLSAKISTNIFNSNPEYFEVNCQTSKSILKENSDDVIIEVTVQLIKMPLYSNESTEITIEIIAEPIY